jgi:hypothetical protein
MATAAATIAGVRRAMVQRKQVADRAREHQKQAALVRIRNPKPPPTEDPSAREEREKRERESREAQETYNLLVTFPTLSYRSSSGGESEDCAICMATLAAGEKVKRLPCHSAHQFHTLCLRQWFETGNRICPSCRYDCYSPPDHGSTVDNQR